MPHPPKTDDQPIAVLRLSEYELQVLETISQHAIEQGAIKPDLLALADGILQKARKGRSELVLARRRRASLDAARPKESGA